MLRSWRSPLRVGIFPDRVWLAHAENRVVSAPVAPGVTPLAALAALLSQERQNLRSARVLVLTSDQLALQMLVAPQPLLRERSELEAYGRASFDQAGLPMAPSDVVNVIYGRATSPGLALGYSRQWLAALGAMFAEHRLAVVRVLPVTCSAFAYARHAGAKGLAATVLNEPTSCSLLVWKSGQLIHLDAEPRQSDDWTSVRRLLARTKAQFEDIGPIRAWDCDAQSEQLRSLVAEVYDAATMAVLTTWALIK